MQFDGLSELPSSSDLAACFVDVCSSLSSSCQAGMTAAGAAISLRVINTVGSSALLLRTRPWLQPERSRKGLFARLCCSCRASSLAQSLPVAPAKSCRCDRLTPAFSAAPPAQGRTKVRISRVPHFDRTPLLVFVQDCRASKTLSITILQKYSLVANSSRIRWQNVQQRTHHHRQSRYPQRRDDQSVSTMFQNKIGDFHINFAFSPRQLLHIQDSPNAPRAIPSSAQSFHYRRLKVFTPIPFTAIFMVTISAFGEVGFAVLPVCSKFSSSRSTSCARKLFTISPAVKTCRHLPVSRGDVMPTSALPPTWVVRIRSVMQHRLEYNHLPMYR